MGSTSKYHRFHEAGEEANMNNVERFGEPQVSLFTSTKVFIPNSSIKHFFNLNSLFFTIILLSSSIISSTF